MVRQRKQEAERSIVVQVNSENSYQELFNYCSRYGAVKSAFHYKTPDEQNNFILLEYHERSGCEDTLKHCQFNEDNPGVPVISPFLWFKATSTKKSKAKTTTDPPRLRCDDIQPVEEPTLNGLLQSAQSLDDQMLTLYRATCLNDLGTRMRFLAANQLEMALNGMFPFIKAFPFGSSVNGFGKVGCDLDMILRMHPFQRLTPTDNSRLVFHTKANLNNERSQTQRQMEALGDILHLFLPGVSHVRRILQARVPIIKFNHECLDLEVDLSMSNLTGLYMSELLYLFGEVDERVRPLVFCIRKWASATGITNPSPGRWTSNFSLTLLVLFFLQQLKQPILPSVNQLVKCATSNDIRITDNNINCTFLRDLNNLKFQRHNKDSLSYLLTQFFEFYSQFDFTGKAISLNEGRQTLKPDHAAMWIVNPLETSLNVSKNVSFEEVERFKFEVKNAAWILEEKSDKADDPFWGLLNLFKTNKQAIVRPQMFFKSRLVDVNDLFAGGGDHEEAKNHIKFSSSTLKNTVNAIRQQTKREIHKLEMSRTKNKRR